MVVNEVARKSTARATTVRNSGLTNVDLTTFAGHATNSRCIQAEVILDRPIENDNLPR
jgi:hypothetical protein